MDPFSGGPLLAFDDGAAPVQAVRICCCIRVETEEQQGVTLNRFNCGGSQQIDIRANVSGRYTLRYAKSLRSLLGN
jgi:hypothetical protein